MQVTLERGLGVKKVEVKRADVLARVESNLLKHVQEYKEAVAGYKQECLSKLEEAASKVKDNLAEDKPMLPLYLALEMPTSHEDDYKQVIEMLKMEQRDVITLESDEFACYIMDSWKWKQAFVATSTRYANKSSF